MEYRIYTEEDFTSSKWTGGVTDQLAIFPEKARYLERNFIWRLSRAVCTEPETTFSVLSDYDRVLMVLSGETVLAHENVRAIRLGKLEQDRFDGAYVTKSFGKITDYNLMVAKGNQGFLDVIIPEETRSILEAECDPEYERYTVALYCTEGYSTVTIGEETKMLTAGQQLVVNYKREEKSEMKVMGEGTLIRALIFYHFNFGETGPEIIPREKPTFDDFKTCIYLANTQFRGASFVFKKLKNRWIDEELAKAMRKIDCIYLPFFTAILGACLIVAFGASRVEESRQWAALLGGWFALDIFVISPLMYFAVVPKPTRKHIKHVEELTPYEQKVRQKQLQTNERLDRLMSKYKKSGSVFEYDEGRAGKEND